jgi:hypothetical protein
MSGVLRINGKVVDAEEFAYDGCHKIYLIFTAEDRAAMLGHGYGEGTSSILPASELARVWEQTCFLRFISRADLRGPDVVPQGYDWEPIIRWTPH